MAGDARVTPEAQPMASMPARVGRRAAAQRPRPLRWAQRAGIALDVAVAGSLTEALRISVRFASPPFGFASPPFDLADRSVAEPASRLCIRHVPTIDADFDVYRDKGDKGGKGGKPPVNLLRAMEGRARGAVSQPAVACRLLTQQTGIGCPRTARSGRCIYSLSRWRERVGVRVATGEKPSPQPSPTSGRGSKTE